MYTTFFDDFVAMGLLNYVGIIFEKDRIQTFRNMENYRLIIAGTIGSVITLFLTTIFDYLKEGYRAKIDERKIVFQKRIEIAENAVSWFQESIDCYRMMQIACNEMSEEYNAVVWDQFIKSSMQAYNLYLTRLILRENITWCIQPNKLSYGNRTW